MPGPHALAERRREQLEIAYRQGLIAEYTYLRASPGQERAGWDIQPAVGANHFRITSRDVPAFLAGLISGSATTSGQRAAVLEALDEGIGVPAPATPQKRHSRSEHVNSDRANTDRIDFNDLPRLYGIPKATFYVWINRGQFASDLLQDVDRKNPKYADYSNAWMSRREALHWGRAHGRLNPDGTPNPEPTRSAAKRFAIDDTATDGA